jgi:hypothetical protein
MPGFPYIDYLERQEEYARYKSWYTGSALLEQQSQGDKTIDLYPLKINPIRQACLKHAYALFGEFQDELSGPLVIPKVALTEPIDKTVADTIEDALSKVWYENSGGALMMEGGTLSQIYGGCIFKVSWVPDNDPPIRIELIQPNEFVAIPDGINYWSLKEAWVIRVISATDALSYNVNIPGAYGYYLEHWTKDHYEITVNGTSIETNILGDKTIMEGANPFGFVPFVYIPHQRTGTFYGDSLISDAAIGITKEINLRTADAGDATNDQSHSVLAIRNVRGTPQLTRLGNGINVINLGGSQSITGNEQQPDMFAVTRSSITEPMLNLNAELRNDIRKELFVPPVAEGGEDAGSQRSAVTLVIKMWPLTSHVKSERAYWSAGLTIFNRMILKILAEKGLYSVTKEHTSIRIKNKWSPILPRDREAFVQELVARAGVNLGSLEHLITLIGDVEDIDLVMGQIKEWLEFQAEMKAKSVPVQPAFGGQDGSEGNSGGPQGAQRSGGRQVPNSNKTASDQRPETTRTREG